MQKKIASILRHTVVAITAACVLLFGASSARAETKIAVIDTQRAIMETEDGLRVQATLKRLFDTRQSELDAKQRALAEDRDALEKEMQAGKTSKDILQKKYEALLQAQSDIQGQLVEAQREMQRKEREMTTPIWQGMMTIVRRLAAQEGYEIIVDKAAVPYFRADLELTDRVIQLYNAGQPAAPAPAADPAPAGKPKAGATPAATPPAPAKPAATPPAPAKPAAPKK